MKTIFMLVKNDTWSPTASEEQLEELADEGWELVCHHSQSDSWVLRKKVAEPQAKEGNS